MYPCHSLNSLLGFYFIVILLKKQSCNIFQSFIMNGHAFFYTININFVCLMVLNTTFNTISVISWRSVLLVEETGGHWENHRPVTSHWQTLSLHTSPWSRIKLTSVVIGTDCMGSCKSNYHTITTVPEVVETENRYMLIVHFSVYSIAYMIHYIWSSKHVMTVWLSFLSLVPQVTHALNKVKKWMTWFSYGPNEWGKIILWYIVFWSSKHVMTVWLSFLSLVPQVTHALNKVKKWMTWFLYGVKSYGWVPNFEMDNKFLLKHASSE